MKKGKLFFSLFITMFKVGLFTFGGGYAMISVIEREFVEKKKWLTHEEYTDILAIAESTPGPLAVNSATYIGYKTGGFFGSLFATLGVVIPSLIIIFCISLFFDAFIELEYVKYAFYGIQACVIFLIFNAGLKLLLHLKFNLFNTLIFSATLICILVFSLLSISFSSIYYILIGGAIGLSVYFVTLIINSKRIKDKIAFENGSIVREVDKTDEEKESYEEKEEGK